MKTEDLIQGLGKLAWEVPPDSGTANGGADQEQRLPAAAIAGLPELIINGSDGTFDALILCLEGTA